MQFTKSGRFCFTCDFCFSRIYRFWLYVWLILLMTIFIDVLILKFVFKNCFSKCAHFWIKQCQTKSITIFLKFMESTSLSSIHLNTFITFNTTNIHKHPFSFKFSIFKRNVYIIEKLIELLDKDSLVILENDPFPILNDCSLGRFTFWINEWLLLEKDTLFVS